MKNPSVASCLALVCYIVTACSVGAAELDDRLGVSPTRWTNQSGSTMTLTFTRSKVQPGVYQLSGAYVNNASGFECQGHPYPLTGVYLADTQTIAWSVAWSTTDSNCRSVTGWTGYLVSSDSGLQIVTTWGLAYSNGPESRAILEGSSVFTYEDHASVESPRARDAVGRRRSADGRE